MWYTIYINVSRETLYQMTSIGDEYKFISVVIDHI